MERDWRSSCPVLFWMTARYRGGLTITPSDTISRTLSTRPSRPSMGDTDIGLMTLEPGIRYEAKLFEAPYTATRRHTKPVSTCPDLQTPSHDGPASIDDFVQHATETNISTGQVKESGHQSNLRIFIYQRGSAEPFLGLSSSRSV